MATGGHLSMTIVDTSKFEASYLFNIIGEKNRLKLIDCLMSKPQSVADLLKKTRIEKSLLSKHLKVLRSVGLVFAVRSGRSFIYELNPRLLKSGHRRSLFLHCCEIKLNALLKKV